MNTIFYIALIIVVLILVLKFKKGKSCGPTRCQPFQKPARSKKTKSYKESLEEIRKKLEKHRQEEEKKK